MANPEHLAILLNGGGWSAWRAENADTVPDLTGADLCRANLTAANLIGANLSEAILVGADLRMGRLKEANLSGATLLDADLGNAHLISANLSKACLIGAKLGLADLSGANLTEANLVRANLSRANLAGATCCRANFSEAILVKTNLDNSDLTGATVYGISAWDVQLNGTVQRDLIITDVGQNTISVPDLEVAQFIYLILNNQRVRKVIDTITSKVVLILGRFTPERKPVLDAIREDLRKRDYLPIVFDFEKPSSRDLTEMVSTLAHMAKFIIVDLTDPRSLPQELASIVPFLPSVPVQPILLASHREYGMYEHWPRYPWVLPIVPYETKAELLANLAERVIGPAERRLVAAKGSGG